MGRAGLVVFRGSVTYQGRINVIAFPGSKYTCYECVSLWCVVYFVICKFVHCMTTPHSLSLSTKILESTIRDDAQGRVTFYMYAELNGGILPGNLLDRFVKVN